MAATASPYGLEPVKQSNDSPVSGGLREFRIASGAAAMFRNAPVCIVAGNLVPVTSASFGTAKADIYVGVFEGCSYTDSTGSRVYRDAWPNGQVATDAVGLVYHDPEILFRVQASTINFDALAAVGTSYRLLNFATSNAGLRQSIATLDIAGGAATANPLKVVGIGTLPDNTNAVGFVDVLVRINQGCHMFERV